MANDSPITLCLGYPALYQEPYIERLRAIDPRVDVVTLPVDPDSDWMNDPSHLPHDEPPTWATGCAEIRRDALARADGLITLSTPKDLMRVAPRLKWIQSLGAGVEQFVEAGATRDRVVVTNASGISAASMSEFVIGRLLQIWKRFPEADAHQRSHQYVRTYGRTFGGSVLGIVGMGGIGQAVAHRARALGLKVLGLKRTPVNAEVAAGLGVDEMFGQDQLHEMLGRCDAVVIAAPASPETHYMIDAHALQAMKSGSVLVNVARGSLVDTKALIAALNAKHVAAAALDVFEEEPLPAGDALWDTENVFISAHSSVSVDRYMDDIFDLFEENARRFVAGETMRNVVDMEALGFG